MTRELKSHQRRYLAGGLILLAVVLAAAGGFWLQQEKERSKAAMLTRDLDALTISWAAMQALQRNSVFTYFEEYVGRASTQALLKAAQDPLQRDRARLQLFRLLSPAYERLVTRGVRQFHFHLPNGDSLLRFHFPARFGDNLFAVRESIRRANTRLEPVFGFEIGRVVSGFRSVFPIINERGEHLGSVELSMPFKVLLKELQALLPDHSFQLLLNAKRQREILFEEQQGLYEPWPASDQFLVEDPHARRPDSPAPLTAEIERLIEALGASRTALAELASDVPGAQHIDVDSAHYAVLHIPIYDPVSAIVGRLVAYAREPALGTIDSAYRIRLAALLTAVTGLLVALLLLLRAVDDRLAERQRLKVITDTVGQGLYLSDHQGRILSMNPYGCQLLGFTEEALLGRHAHEVLHSHAGNAYQSAEACPIRQALSSGREYRGETSFACADGSVLEVLVVSRPLHEAGRLVGEVAVFEDIGERKRFEHQLEHNAHYDALTGLPNRVLLADRLEQAMQRARRFDARIAVAFIDLDKFKPVNDQYGHDTGDQLLAALAERMRGSLRAVDTLARIGGDEFVAVLGDIDADQDALELVERLLTALRRPFAVGEGLELQVSASIGLTFYPQNRELNPDQLLRQADQAMYQAKLKGKNSRHLFDLQLDARQRDHNARLERIRRGLARGEFVLHYQPLVNLRSGAIIAVEALIRWQHPDEGLLEPGRFLPDIEDSDTGLALGEWVLGSALAQRAAWSTQGLELTVCVNISPHHLQQAGFSEQLEEILADYPDLPSGALELEILESSALSQVAHVSALVDRWRERGVRFAIDDFGTGFSSLSYLKRLPVATLKVDRSFVDDIDIDADDLPILEGVQALGRAFKLATVAEGVETLSQAQLLLQLGYDVVQGYGIARPMPPEALAPWIADWKPDAVWASCPRLATTEYPLLYALVATQGEASALAARDKLPLHPPPGRRHLQDCLERRDDWPSYAAFIAHLDTARYCMDTLYAAASTAQRSTPPGVALDLTADMRALHDSITKALDAARELFMQGPTAGP